MAAAPRSGALQRLGGGIVDVRRWHLAAASLLAATVVSGAVRLVRDLRDEAVQQKRRLLWKMANSSSSTAPRARQPKAPRLRCRPQPRATPAPHTSSR
ncbi:expressed protein [Chlorella variabilis]|uniref:Expressed protein n=1 Tax=Chlorella variabilis TaxID=554065 RepID=E1ZUT0_CHLVA|nr:expressed protein [Chlorella variabilis]EFN50415.1 expressed protein [Chlorella variabilis]|eukprot:XP_005842547.1 expressed protein [Chlorella variabilis]